MQCDQVDMLMFLRPFSNNILPKHLRVNFPALYVHAHNRKLATVLYMPRSTEVDSPLPSIAQSKVSSSSRREQPSCSGTVSIEW